MWCLMRVSPFTSQRFVKQKAKGFFIDFLSKKKKRSQSKTTSIWLAINTQCFSLAIKLFVFITNHKGNVFLACNKGNVFLACNKGNAFLACNKGNVFLVSVYFVNKAQNLLLERKPTICVLFDWVKQEMTGEQPNRGCIAQPVEHRAFNLMAAGSSPATLKPFLFFSFFQAQKDC